MKRTIFSLLPCCSTVIRAIVPDLQLGELILFDYHTLFLPRGKVRPADKL